MKLSLSDRYIIEAKQLLGLLTLIPEDKVEDAQKIVDTIVMQKWV